MFLAMFLPFQRRHLAFPDTPVKFPPLLSRDLIISPTLPLFKDEALLSIKRGR